jgi:hypothetical protein
MLGPIYELAGNSKLLSEDLLGVVDGEPEGLEFPRFIFEGPRGGGDSVKFGFFAGIHGDEPSGVNALVRLVQELVRQPEMAAGYRLFLYPACNPTGLLKGTRFSQTQKDLNREFWKESSEVEVRLLEKEIRAEKFHGLISLHEDDTSSGMYGFVRGAVLSKGLLEPALRAAESVLPRNNNPVIDGFPAQSGIISECYDGILTSPPELQPAPFEIILETPHAAPVPLQVEAVVRAMSSILVEYQKLLSFAADL